MKDSRPVNLKLTSFKYPLPAITSILHRISGAFIFFGLAVLLFLLQRSLESEAGFNEVREWLSGPAVKFLLWAIVAGFLFHLVAGIKHLFMDIGIGETMEGAKAGSAATLVISIIAMLLAGVWIW